jgi:hypothetical protein
VELLEVIAVLPKLFAFGVSALTFALFAATERLGRPSLTSSKVFPILRGLAYGYTNLLA